MKRFLFSFIAAAALLVSVLPTHAQTTGKLKAANVRTSGKEDFEVDVQMDVNPGLSMLKIEVQYDNSLFALKSAENGKIFDKIYITSQTIDKIPYIVIFGDPLAKQNKTGKGSLLKLTFETKKQDASGTINISATDSLNIDQKAPKLEGCSVKVNSANSSQNSLNAESSGSKNTVSQKSTGSFADKTYNITGNGDHTGGGSESESRASQNKKISSREKQKAKSIRNNILAFGIIIAVGAAVTMLIISKNKKRRQDNEEEQLNTEVDKNSENTDQNN